MNSYWVFIGILSENIYTIALGQTLKIDFFFKGFLDLQVY